MPTKKTLWKEYEKDIIKWVILGLLGVGVTFAGLIWNNSRSFPDYKKETDKEIVELKEQIKELKADAKERDAKWWDLYVELNTALVGQKYKLNQELNR